MTLQKYVNRTDVANWVQVDPRTISRRLKIPNRQSTERVLLKAVAKVLHTTPEFLMQCAAGLDYCVTLQQASQHLSLDEATLQANALKPVVRLGKGGRFSAKALGMLRAPVAAMSQVEAANLIRGRIEIGIADGKADGSEAKATVAWAGQK